MEASGAWRRTLAAMSAFQLVVSAGFSFAMPFLPLYLHRDLGVVDDAAVKLWSGAIFAGSSATMALMGPIWGSVADRYGPRLMVYRATFSAVVIVALMALVQSPEQLLVLRVIQGAFTGVNAAAMTMIAVGTPRDRLGLALGVVQTCGFAGVSLGPLLGGAVAEWLGYRAAFLGSAVIMGLAGFIVVFGAAGGRGPTEGVRAGGRPADAGGPRAGLAEVVSSPVLLALIAVSFSVQFGSQVVSPILPLYVQSLALPDEPVASTTGLIVGVTALLSAVAAAALGRLGDRIGHVRVLLVCCFGAALAYYPQALVTGNGQLLALRGLTGLFWGGILPSNAALLAMRAVPERRGTVYGVVASANSLGNGVGPLLGAMVAVWLGMPAVFVLTATVLLGVGVWIARVLASSALAPQTEGAPEAP